MGATGLGFRTRLFLAIILLTTLVAGILVGFGFLGFNRELERDFQEDLQHYSNAVAASLAWADPLAIDASALPTSGELVGEYRVWRGEEVLLSSAGFPDSEGAWGILARSLADNYRLEVALNRRAHNRALTAYLRASSVALLLSWLLALAWAYLLLDYLTRPLARLEAGMEAVAGKREPAPLPVLGNDEVARISRVFNRMSVRVAQALERERGFTRYASHELRNPLAVALASLEAYQSGALPAAVAADSVERSLKQMQGILHGLLQLAREPGSFTQVDLVELALASAAELADPRIQLEVVGSPVVLAPAEALANALRNLLVNALHYSTGPVWLRVGPGAVLEVQDQGPGVPEAALTRLGEPFFRVGQNGEGSGLGLALVHQVVESVGGKLVFSNLAEGGFLARIEFPGGSDLLAAGPGS